MELVHRHMQAQIEDALEWARVVMIHGARQTGKTTLARSICDARGGTYLSMDDEALRHSVLDDPAAFLASQPQPVIVDEVQRGGDRLILAVKQLVDTDTTPGRFVLTGSTNFLTVPNISESLAGRVQIFRLNPFSEAELVGAVPAEIDRWFGAGPAPAASGGPDRADYFERVCRGGFPDAVGLSPQRRRRWFESYIDTVVQRDIAALADIRKSAALAPLLRWTAGVTGSPVNLSDASRRLGLSRAALTTYMEWLRTVFLVRELPAWSRGLTASTARRPKHHLIDSGLAASLIGVSADGLAIPTAPAAGPLLETFTVNEIARQATVSASSYQLSHYRDHKGREIDLIITSDNGDVVAVEIKATGSPAPRHMTHLEWLRDRLDTAAPGTFSAGILLYTGPHTLATGDRLHMRPVSSLWSNRQTQQDTSSTT